MNAWWALALLLLAVTPAVAMLRRSPTTRGRHCGDLAAQLLSRRRQLVLERELGWTEQ